LQDSHALAAFTIDTPGKKRHSCRLPTKGSGAYRSGWVLRTDSLDHLIAINESQLRRVIRSYIDYYHADRTHLGLKKDAPEGRPIESREMGEVVSIPRVGGLHHRYSRVLQRAA
jgi:hypothetical protein